MKSTTIAKSFAYNTHSPARDHKVYGHVELGKWANVLDCVHVPFLNTTYVLVRESHYGSTGGLAKSVVLYAVTPKGREVVERDLITHQFDRARDRLYNWELEKIHVGIKYRIRDCNPDIGRAHIREISLDVTAKMVEANEPFFPESSAAHNPRFPGCHLIGEHVRSTYRGCTGSFLMPLPYFEEKVFIRHTVHILNGQLTKKFFRRNLQQWGLLKPKSLRTLARQFPYKRKT